MAWESYSLMKCKKCGKMYEVEESTVIIAKNDYNKCPLCHFDGERVSRRSMLDVMNEQHEKFKGRKRRTM